jgi:hypothetical protein
MLPPQGEVRSSSGHLDEGRVKTSRVVQHIGEAVQAQASTRVACGRLSAHAAPCISAQHHPARVSQVNLAKLDACARMEGSREKPSKHVISVQAANILAARAKLEDALWEPWLRAKARAPFAWRAAPCVLIRLRADFCIAHTLRLVGCCCVW